MQNIILCNGNPGVKKIILPENFSRIPAKYIYLTFGDVPLNGSPVEAEFVQDVQNP